MFTSDLQGECFPFEEQYCYEDKQEVEEYLGYAIESLEAKCPTTYLDPLVAVNMLDDFFNHQHNISAITAANIRYIKATLISKIEIPF